MALLEVVGPDGAGQHINLDATELVVGRDATAGLRLRGAKISRRHARFYRVQSAVWVEDLNSANGVYINGERMGGPTPLPPDTRVNIGEYTLTLRATPAADATAAPSDQPVMVWVGQSGAVNGRRIALTLGDFDVGRSARYQVQLDDASVSRHHATGHVSPGRVAIKDMGSRNGTYVNGKRITQADVIAGDTVRFGHLSFLAITPETQSPAVATPPPSPATQPAAKHQPAAADAGPRPKPLPEVGSLGSVVSYSERRPTGHPEAGSAVATPRAPWPVLLWLLSAAVLGALLITALAVGHALDRRKERRYEAEMAEGLTRAEALMRQGSWRRAQEAFESVLHDDPLNAAARRGRHQAELHLDYEAAMSTLGEPESPHYDGQIFVRLSPLLADQDAAVLGERPRTLLDQARRQMSQSCALEALGACRTLAWARCRDEAVCAVLFDSDNMLGAALLDQALESVPNPPLADGALGEAARRRATLAARYPRPGIRGAILAYATGDLTTATKRLRRIPGADAAAAAGTLWALGRAQKAGDVALGRGNTAAAIRAFEEAVALDARLLPPGQPSVLGRSLLDRGTTQWLREGERAFNRGRYSDALSAWQRGLQLDPNHRGILHAVERLESRAQQMFDALAHATRPTAEVCNQLHEVQGMVRRDQPLYQATLDRLAACPNGVP